MELISRRKLISMGAAASAASLLPSHLFSESLETSPAPFGAPVAANLLVVNSASDPVSAAAMNTLFPGLLSDKSFQPFLPMTFLVTNVSNKSMRAFTTHWTKTSASGVDEWTVMHYFHRRGGSSRQKMHWGAKGNKTRYTGNISVIKYGATRLISPYFNVSVAHYKTLSNLNWSEFLTTRARPEISIADLTGAGTTFTMTIDAAITHDYVSVGPRDGELVKVFRNTRNAEHDETVSVLKHMAKGATTAQIKELLTRHASGLAFDIKPETDLYYRVRQRQAKVLLRRLNKARPEQFQRTLNYLKSQPMTEVRSVSATNA